MLHHNRELFEQVVLQASEYLQIDAAIIEKDYYVTLLLQEIVKQQPDIIFKGGTSLSKCYRIIDRFSEDIDLTIFLDEKPTESQRKRLKENIVSSRQESSWLWSGTVQIRVSPSKQDAT